MRRKIIDEWGDLMVAFVLGFVTSLILIILICAYPVMAKEATAKENTKAIEAAEAIEISSIAIKAPETEITIVEPKPIEATEDTAENTTEETKRAEMETETTQAPKYTEEDLYILTHILVGECHTYSDEHQLAVGSVFLNRVNSNSFPNTFKEVAFQKGQYACVKDGNYYREATERNIANAKYLLENGSVLPDNVVYQAEFKQGKGVHKKIGNTYFCY